MSPSAAPRYIRLFAVILLAVALASCDGILSSSNRQPRDARVVITGTSPVELQLVTSTRFTAEQDPETGIYHINFQSSDVLEQALPLERTVRLDTDRFVARLINPSLDHTANVVMQIYFDGNLVFSQEATLRDASLDFIHVFY